MSTLETYRLILEPDRDMPRLLRLRWETVPVTIRDVLFHGVHPWSGPDAHATLPEAFLRCLNAAEVLFAELEPFGYSSPVSVSSGNRWEGPARFARTLQTVQNDLRFTADITYQELLELAKGVLGRRWNHGLARELLRDACPGFQEARRLIKRRLAKIQKEYNRIDQDFRSAVDGAFAAFQEALQSQLLSQASLCRLKESLPGYFKAAG